MAGAMGTLWAVLSGRRPVCPGRCSARSCGRAGHVLCGGPALHQCRGDASEHLCSGDPGAGPFSGGILGTAAVGHHPWPPLSVMRTTDVPRNGPVPWEVPGYSTGLSCAETHAEALPGFHPKPVLLEVSQSPRVSGLRRGPPNQPPEDPAPPTPPPSGKALGGTVCVTPGFEVGLLPLFLCCGSPGACPLSLTEFQRIPWHLTFSLRV